jgi:hypothetical protein
MRRMDALVAELRALETRIDRLQAIDGAAETERDPTTRLN